MKIGFTVLLFLMSFRSQASTGLMQESFHLPVDTLNGNTIELDGRIDRPVGGTGKWPLLIMSSGSGPSDVDYVIDAPHISPEQCSQYGGQPLPGDKCRWRFYEMTAKTLAAQGIAVVRLGKRGVHLDEDNNPLPPDMQQHGTGTLMKRVEDVEKLITFLRANHPEIDTDAYYLYGISEGTTISTMFARKHSPEVKGLVLLGAVLDSLENIFHFQAVTVQWPQLLKQADADNNGVISAEEFDLTKLAKPDYTNIGAPAFADRIKNYAMMGVEISFSYFDRDADDKIDQQELTERLEQDIWLPSLAALKNGDEAGFKKYDPDGGVNSYEQVKEWFSMGRNGDELLQLNIPISIFIGKRDLNTPAAQLDWFLPLVNEQGKQDLIYSELADDAHLGPNLTAAAARRIQELGWGSFK